MNIFLFQSQTRSQSPGDHNNCIISLGTLSVSIADAKPIPWRPDLSHQCHVAATVSIADAKPIPWRHTGAVVAYVTSLVSIADAKPIPWRQALVKVLMFHRSSFNRRREANPLATQ